MNVIEKYLQSFLLGSPYTFRIPGLKIAFLVTGLLTTNAAWGIEGLKLGNRLTCETSLIQKDGSIISFKEPTTRAAAQGVRTCNKEFGQKCPPFFTSRVSVGAAGPQEGVGISGPFKTGVDLGGISFTELTISVRGDIHGGGIKASATGLEDATAGTSGTVIKFDTRKFKEPIIGLGNIGVLKLPVTFESEKRDGVLNLAWLQTSYPDTVQYQIKCSLNRAIEGKPPGAWTANVNYKNKGATDSLAAGPPRATEAEAKQAVLDICQKTVAEPSTCYVPYTNYSDSAIPENETK